MGLVVLPHPFPGLISTGKPNTALPSPSEQSIARAHGQGDDISGLMLNPINDSSKSDMQQPMPTIGLLVISVIIMCPTTTDLLQPYFLVVA